MRYSLKLAFLLTFPFISLKAQEIKLPVDEETGKITYSEVVQVNRKDKDELYISAREWFVKSFKSSQDVIQLNDKEEGIIVCR